MRGKDLEKSKEVASPLFGDQVTGQQIFRAPGGRQRQGFFRLTRGIVLNRSHKPNDLRKVL
jgi:hypothetical protein